MNNNINFKYHNSGLTHPPSVHLVMKEPFGPKGRGQQCSTEPGLARFGPVWPHSACQSVCLSVLGSLRERVQARGMWVGTWEGEGG